MILLSLACAAGDSSDSAPPAPPQGLAARWTSVDLSCQGDATVLEGWSQGTQASAAVFVASGMDELQPVEGSYPWQALGADPAGSWQHWQLIQLMDKLPCPKIEAWQAQLLDSDGELLACLDDQGTGC